MSRFLYKDSIFYHGTYNEFTRFRPLSHFGSKYAADFFAHSGVKKGEVAYASSNLNEIIFQKTSMPKTRISGKVIPVKLNINNTYELQDVEATHDKNFYRGLLLFYFIEELGNTKLPLSYDYIATSPFETSISWNDVKKELLSDSLYTPMENNEDMDRYHLFLQRMIQFFESMGFDGFHYTNEYEDDGHISYIPFRPENIIRLDLPAQKVNYNIRNKKFPVISDCRKLMPEEECLLKIEYIYREEMFENKLYLFNINRKLMHRPDSIRGFLSEKAYYSKILFNEVLPKIEKITNQPRYGYHGLNHTQQVALFGIDLALSVHQDPMPVILAAGLHDCARTNDGYCEQHGPNCEPIARKFLKDNYPNLLPSDVEKIVSAVKNHTIGRLPKDLISACLWDADRIRLSWELGYKPGFFSTPYGTILAKLPGDKQEEYKARQDKFLIKHGIRTLEQIMQEREMIAKTYIYNQENKFNTR